MKNQSLSEKKDLNLHLGKAKKGEVLGETEKMLMSLFGNKPIKDESCKSEHYSGKGVMYYENGKKRYDGFMVRGKEEGEGISFFKNGKKSYEGL